MGILDREDPYRDGLARFLGYGHVIGITSVPLHNIPVVATAGVAITAVYCAADIYNKTTRQYITDKKPIVCFGDAFLWQSLASLMLPDLTIFGVRLGTSTILASLPTRTKISSIVGLAIIPIIIKPIDHFVDGILDNTYRKWT